MPTYLDYSYDDRNGPAYPGVNDVAYAERMLAERQLEKDAQAADLGRQDAMINIARGNVSTPAGVVYSNDLGRSGAYRGYAINERNPYANMTARWVTDPSSGQVMFQHLVGANSAQPHFVPGQALPPGALSAPLLNTMLYAMSTAPVTPVVRTRGGGGGGGGAKASAAASKQPLTRRYTTLEDGYLVHPPKSVKVSRNPGYTDYENRNLAGIDVGPGSSVSPDSEAYAQLWRETSGTQPPAQAQAPAQAQQPLTQTEVAPGASAAAASTIYPYVSDNFTGRGDPVELPFNLYQGKQLTLEGKWLQRFWNNLTPFEQEGLKNGTLSIASVMNSYPEGVESFPSTTDTSRDRAIRYYMSRANAGPM